MYFISVSYVSANKTINLKNKKKLVRCFRYRLKDMEYGNELVWRWNS